MKTTKLKEFFTRKRIAIFATCAVLAVGGVAGGIAIHDAREAIEIASSNVDPILDENVEITPDETPLASTPQVKTTTKTTKKTTKKTVTLKKKSTKSYTKKLKATTKKTTKTTKKNSTTTVKKVTTVKSQPYETYKKNSNKKTVKTYITTTVKTTTTTIPTTTTSAASTGSGSTVSEVQVTKIAPKMDTRVLDAFTTLGMKVIINPSVSYSGYFSAKDKSITLKTSDDTIYHELGHFLAFIAGNYDQSSAFATVYKKESGSYSGYNKAYVTQNAAEYFAESVRDYILNAGSLKSSRPETYAAVETALSKVTTAQVSKIKLMLQYL